MSLVRKKQNDISYIMSKYFQKTYQIIYYNAIELLLDALNNYCLMVTI